MRVCEFCGTSKRLETVNITEEIMGDPRGDSTFLQMDMDVCNTDRKYLKESKWRQLADRREVYDQMVRKALDETNE